MLVLLFGASLSAEDGGYKPIAVDDPLVAPAQAYLNRVVPNLFPDGKGPGSIDSAEIQIVHGYNLRLNVSVPRTIAFTTVLSFSSKTDPPKLVSIVGKQVAVVPSGWQWHDLSEVTTEKLNAIMTTLRDKGGFTGEVAELIAVRSQVVAGENLHVIFHDNAAVVWAAILYFPPGNSEGKVSYLHKAE
jgi:hypothetical protein